MIRTLWLIISAALAVFLAPVLYDALPVIIADLSGGIGSVPVAAVQAMKSDATVRAVGLWSSAAVIFTLLGFLLPAVIEGVMAGIARSRIRSAVDRASARTPFDQMHFRETFVYAPFMADAASRYGAFLTPVEVETRGWKGTPVERHEKLHAAVPASDYFNTRTLVGDRLFLWLFRPLPPLLLGVGLVAFFAVLPRVADATTVDPWPAVIIPAAIAVALAGAAAILIYLMVRTLAGFRRAQTESLCLVLDELFHYTPISKQLRDLLAANQAQMRAVESAVKSLHVTIERTSESEAARITAGVEATGRTLAGSLRNDISAALQEPLEKLALTAKLLTDDQSAQVQQILGNTLKAFLGELEKHVGQELQALSTVLEKATETATKFDQGMGASGRLLTKFVRAQNQELSAALEKHAASFDGTIRSLEDVAARSLTAAGESVGATAAELQALSARLETLLSGDTLRAFNDLIRQLQETGGALRQILEERPHLAAVPAAPANQGGGGDAPAPANFSKELRRIRNLSARGDLPEL